jgi:hypothetical protein
MNKEKPDEGTYLFEEYDIRVLSPLFCETLDFFIEKTNRKRMARRYYFSPIDFTSHL